ncbi:MAG: response regulator receiver protein [halophilic archaeon J07HX64]|nr:MAG: response regulator receiver protein [halophilic archaeon J07HX64]
MLIVDDEREVADVYALRLGTEYETRATYSGSEALDMLDESVDIVLLDRRMPDQSGDEVLAELREQEYDCRVIMLTAVDPGRDIVEMNFDDYLCKPVEKDDLVGAIEQQLQVKQHDGRLGEYLEVCSKLSLLEDRLPPGSEELDQLRRQADQLESKLDGRLDDVDDVASLAAFDASFSSIDRHSG